MSTDIIISAKERKLIEVKDKKLTKETSNTRKIAERERTLMNPSIKINLGKVKRSISKNTKHKPSSKADYNKPQTKIILVTEDNYQ